MWRLPAIGTGAFLRYIAVALAVTLVAFALEPMLAVRLRGHGGSVV